MNNLNYDYFEEYKRLDKLCCDMYNTSHNGVTHYIDDMKATPYSTYHRIPNWESDFKRLQQLRHIRNILAHTEGAFYEEQCTQSDIDWIHSFVKRILTQSDPLALLHQNSKMQNTATTATTTRSKSKKPKALLLVAITIFNLFLMLIFITILHM